jgi:RND family efflux transporter MFP subunit
VVTPERTVLHREVSQPGAIEAFEETPVFAKIAGYVKTWKVDRGDRVRKDQLLAELSVPEMNVELEQKEALIVQADEQVEQARKAATAAEAAFKSAEAQIREAEAGQERADAEVKRTRSQSERLTRVGESGLLNRESVAEIRLGYEVALAGLHQAEARVQSSRATREESKATWDKARAGVRVAEAHASVARKNRDYVKTQLEYTRLTAPYDGIITDRRINTGDFVQSATAGIQRPLYVVQRADLARIFVQVPESDADWVQKGATATLRIPALRGLALRGTVARTAWALQQDTRTLRAEIDLPNPPLTPPARGGGEGGILRPGLYVYATLKTDLPDVLTLPRSAVATEGDVTRGYQTYCYQVQDGMVRRLSIELGAGDSERVEVRRKRTQPGGPWEQFTGKEEIVQGNLKEIRDGQRVTTSR